MKDKLVTHADASEVFEGYLMGDPGIPFEEARATYLKAETIARQLESRRGKWFGSRTYLTADRLQWMGVDPKTLQVVEENPPGRWKDVSKLTTLVQVPLGVFE